MNRKDEARFQELESRIHQLEYETGYATIAVYPSVSQIVRMLLDRLNLEAKTIQRTITLLERDCDNE